MQKVLIVGTGSAGLSVAAQLRRSVANVKITMVDSAKYHYYQPGWSLVGGGVFNKEQTQRETRKLIPDGVEWINDDVETFDPENKSVQLKHSKQRHGYDALIVATGIHSNFDNIKGLRAHLDDPTSPVTSIYNYNYAEKHWRVVRDQLLNAPKPSTTSPKELIFTQPTTGIKCGGAPQKVMYMTEQTLRATDGPSNIRLPSAPYGGSPGQWLDARTDQKLHHLTSQQPSHPYFKFRFALPQQAIFGTPHYATLLEHLRVERQVDALYGHELVEVLNKKEAAFKTQDGSIKVLPFDLLHAVPNMYPPECIKNSPIADPASGFVQVDPHTLQHMKYPDVFSIGDCSNLPTSKTAAAIASQAPVLVHNLTKHLKGETENWAGYDGYTSCPIIVQKGDIDGRLVLAEFDYAKNPAESCHPYLLTTDQREPSWLAYHFKKTIFPPVYWNLYLGGRWYGKDLLWKKLDTSGGWKDKTVALGSASSNIKGGGCTGA